MTSEGLFDEINISLKMQLLTLQLNCMLHMNYH